jgi:ComEC/Rec2-related protein
VKYGIVATTMGILLFSNISLYTFNSLNNSIANSFEGVFEGKITEVLTTKGNIKRFTAKGYLHSKIFKEKFQTQVLFTLFDKENKIKIQTDDKFIANANFRIGQPKIIKEDFNEKAYLISKKSHFFGLISSKDYSFKSRGNSLNNWLFRIRQDISKTINDIVPDHRIAAIMIALTTGDKSGIDKETQNEFSITGTSHILAISGLHVGIFSMFIYLIVGLIKSRSLRLVVFIALVWIFVFFTGGQPSAIRAAIMASMIAYFIYYGKYPNPLNILLFTFIVYVIIEPTVLFSISFQLSFLAITGIFLLYKPFYSSFKMLFIKENSLTKFISSSFAISLAATVLTTVLTSYYFNTFSYVYLFSNLIILPLMTFATIQSLLFMFFSTISLSIAQLFAKTAYLTIDISIRINEYFVQLGNHKFGGEELIAISIISSIILIYIFTASSYRQIGFRITISALAIYFILGLNYKREKSVTILPREKYTGLILSNQNTEHIILADRKKDNHLQSDFALVNHINNSEKNIYIYMTGNNSININDQVKHLPNVKSKFISLDKIDSISKALNIDPLYTITNVYD